MKQILGATRNCGKWFNIEAVKFPEIILAIAMLEKILPINVLEIFVVLLGCRTWRRK